MLIQITSLSLFLWTYQYLIWTCQYDFCYALVGKVVGKVFGRRYVEGLYPLFVVCWRNKSKNIPAYKQ